MNKQLIILAMLLAAQAAWAQNPGPGDPSAAKRRAEVKAEQRTSGAPVTKNIEAPGTPSTRGSDKSRASVKAETRASGSPVTGNIEAPNDASTRGSGLARSDVKASTRASGSLGTQNTEVPATPRGKMRHRKDKAHSDAR